MTHSKMVTVLETHLYDDGSKTIVKSDMPFYDTIFYDG